MFIVQWSSELKGCVTRLEEYRKRMREILDSKVPDRDWSGITKQRGMFYYSGLTEAQGKALMTKHSVYILPSSGRINLGAVTESNVEYIANAIADVVLTN